MTFEQIDLSKLPAPVVVEPLSFETILAEMTADLVARHPEFADTIYLESDPVQKVLQTCAYREVLIRNRVNTASKAVMLPYALASNLDNLAALVPVVRKVIQDADNSVNPPVPLIMESDEEFRRRIRLAPSAYTTAGSEDAYVFHALSASASIKDARAFSPSPNYVTVPILSRYGDGTPNEDDLEAVRQALQPKGVRPLNDIVTVVAADLQTYNITVELTLLPGPDSSLVMETINEAVEAYAEAQHKIGGSIQLSKLYAAIEKEGVDTVNLISPVSDILGNADPANPFAPVVDTISITDLGAI